MINLSEEKNLIQQLREHSGMNKKQFSEYFNIPYTNIKNWESHTKQKRKCPMYLYDLMEYKLYHEGLLNSKKEDDTK